MKKGKADLSGQSCLSFGWKHVSIYCQCASGSAVAVGVGVGSGVVTGSAVGVGVGVGAGSSFLVVNTTHTSLEEDVPDSYP